MSNTIRHKLFDLESAPPPAAWVRIAAELDELNAWRPVGNKLQEAEIPAPAQHWNQLLSHFEESGLAGKLYDIEETPPTRAWEKIRQGILPETVLPEKQKIIPWFRYAAAASILLLISFGALRLIQSRHDSPGMTARQDTLPLHSSQPADNSKEELTKLVAGITADNEDARNDAALEASKKTFAKLDLPARKLGREVSNFYFNNQPEPPAGTRSIDINSEVQPAQAMNTDRYITLMTPEGNIIRVSKKFGDMVCCISGETGDPACQDQLKKWREKIVTSSLGHSADSFMDILMLINSSAETHND